MLGDSEEDVARDNSLVDEEGRALEWGIMNANSCNRGIMNVSIRYAQPTSE